jgi:Transposase DDE domain
LSSLCAPAAGSRAQQVSGRVRKRIEEVFGWTKATAGFRKTRHRGLGRIDWMFTLTATAYNLVRLSKLVGAVA